MMPSPCSTSPPRSRIKRDKDAEVKVLKEENAALRERLAAVQDKFSVLEKAQKEADVKIAAIELMVGSASRQVVLPVK